MRLLVCSSETPLTINYDFLFFSFLGSAGNHNDDRRHHTAQLPAKTKLKLEMPLKAMVLLLLLLWRRTCKLSLSSPSLMAPRA